MFKSFTASLSAALLALASGTTLAFTDSLIDSAVNVALDSPVSGRLASSSDDDAYRFTIPGDGDVEITLEHNSDALARYPRTYWVANLYSADNLVDSLGKIRLDGSEQIDTLSKSLNAGRYLLLVEDFYYTSLPYTVTVSFSEDGALDVLPANAIDNAVTLELNQRYDDSLSHASDVNYYQFTTSTAGNLSLNLAHNSATLAQSALNVWQADLYTLDLQRLRSVSLTGSDLSTTALEGLPAGSYLLRLRSNHYSSEHFSLQLGLQAGEYFERSPNDSVETATVLNLGHGYEGNLASPNDVDFYSLQLTTPQTLSMVLSHSNDDLADTVQVFWKAEVFAADDTAIPLYSIALSGNEFSEDADLALPAGHYVVKVSDSYYNGSQYVLSLSTR